MPLCIEEKHLFTSISISIQTDLVLQDIEELEKLKESNNMEFSVISKLWFEANEERVPFTQG